MAANNDPNWGPSGPGPRPAPGVASSVGQRIDEAVELIEMELRHAIAYVNDSVVPQVRRESISAMRTAADTLRNLADRFEQHTNPVSPDFAPRSNPNPSPYPPGNPPSTPPGEPHS